MENNKTLIFILTLVVLFQVFHKEKYEGQTAEEWFYEYDYLEAEHESLTACMEDYDSLEIEEQINFGGVSYYCG